MSINHKISTIIALVLVSIVLRSTTYAQIIPNNTISFGIRAAELTGGDVGGQFYEISYDRMVNDLVGLSTSIGYLTSINRDLYSVRPRALLFLFRDRKHLFLNFAIEFVPVNINIGSSDHQLEIDVGLSGRLRWEEKAQEMYLPAFFQSAPAEEVRKVLDQCGTPGVYCIDSYGRDVVPSGQYWLRTVKFHKRDVGLLGRLSYVAAYGRYEMAIEAGYYRYRKQLIFFGTHMYYYGASLGYRF